LHHIAEVADHELRIVAAGIDVKLVGDAAWREQLSPVRYNRRMADSVIHISEEEAVRDFASVLARVRAGAEVVIESEGSKSPAAVIHLPVPARRSISECIALARRHEEETGESPVLDPDFAADVEEVIRNREPWNPPAWD